MATWREDRWRIIAETARACARAQEFNNHADYFYTFCIFPIVAGPNRAHIGRINPAPLWGHRTKDKPMFHRTSPLFNLEHALRARRVRVAGNPNAHRHMTAALSFLQMAEWSYGAERRAYLAKAQNAFRLSFL